MNVMTPDECFQWLQEQGMNTSGFQSHDDLFWQTSSPGFESVKLRFPKDSGRKVALAHLIFNQFKSDSHVLLWLKSWDVWPSAGHKPLLMRLRQSLGCSTNLESTPCHLF